MKKIEQFEDLEVWQLARELAKQVYCLTAGKNLARDFGLVGQMQRSAVSVMANIAEGFERRSNKEFIHFLSIAKGSCGEVRSHLYVSLDVGYINNDEFTQVSSLAETISKSIAGFTKYLKSRDSK
jgi:four helix bundle protein